MTKEDEDNTSFTTPEGLYCYQRMSFDLKNAGAEFYNMINHMFSKHLGKNIEAYVDNIMIKLKIVDSFLDDVVEAFDIMNHYGLKLNPKKCSFGVEAGRFLGYMVSKQGIEANPSKIQALLEMKPPNTMKDVQKLTDRIIALNRFLAKAGDKVHPFYQVLRNLKSNNIS